MYYSFCTSNSWLVKIRNLSQVSTRVLGFGTSLQTNDKRTGITRTFCCSNHLRRLEGNAQSLPAVLKLSSLTAHELFACEIGNKIIEIKCYGAVTSWTQQRSSTVTSPQRWRTGTILLWTPRRQTRTWTLRRLGRRWTEQRWRGWCRRRRSPSSATWSSAGWSSWRRRCAPPRTIGSCWTSPAATCWRLSSTARRRRSPSYRMRGSSATPSANSTACWRPFSASRPSWLCPLSR